MTMVGIVLGFMAVLVFIVILFLCFGPRIRHRYEDISSGPSRLTPWQLGQIEQKKVVAGSEWEKEW